MCQSVIKVKNGGRIPGFLDELGPFLVVFWKIGKFQLATLKLSAFSGIKSKGHYIFQLFRSVEVTGRYISQLLEALKGFSILRVAIGYPIHTVTFYISEIR